MECFKKLFTFKQLALWIENFHLYKNFTKQIQLKPHEQNLTTNKHYCVKSYRLYRYEVKWFPIGIAVNNQSTPCNHGKEYTLRLEQGINKLFSCHVIIVLSLEMYDLHNSAEFCIYGN
ncbi:hypothetical protein GQX74_008672 [Glossina fuscipes]|nr:hypothetical protein GQX74_008672 [Glossina fuscipes]